MGIKKYPKKYVIKWLPLLFEGETSPASFFSSILLYTVQTQVQNAFLQLNKYKFKQIDFVIYCYTSFCNVLTHHQQ